MRRRAIALLVAGLLLAACTGRSTTHAPIPASALDGMLLSATDVNSVMGTTAMKVSDAITDVSDHSNLLPNVNCLGIWDIGEKKVYDGSGWTAIHGQALRQPHSGDWDSLVVQAVVAFPSADAAKKFFTTSADRWSKCSNNHKVNMHVNDVLTTFVFGDLGRTDTQLSMHVTRGAGERQCQRVLSVVNNVVVEVAACARAVGDQAATLANKIASKAPA
jgi:PknH-like extracellular domain